MSEQRAESELEAIRKQPALEALDRIRARTRVHTEAEVWALQEDMEIVRTALAAPDREILFATPSEPQAAAETGEQP